MNTLFEKRERNEPRVWNRAVESLEKKKDFVSLENIALKVSKFRHTHTHTQDLDLSRPRFVIFISKRIVLFFPTTNRAIPFRLDPAFGPVPIIQSKKSINVEERAFAGSESLIHCGGAN